MLVMHQTSLSSTHLEQPRSQPEHKGRPNAVGFPFGGFTPGCRAEMHIIGSGTGRLTRSNAIIRPTGKRRRLLSRASRRSGPNVGTARVATAGDAVASDTALSELGLGTLKLLSFLGVGAFPSADLLAGVFLLLFPFLGLKLAAGLADLLLASGGIDIAA